MNGIKETELDITDLFNTENKMQSWNENSGSLIPHFLLATMPHCIPRPIKASLWDQKKKERNPSLASSGI